MDVIPPGAGAGADTLPAGHRPHEDVESILRRRAQELARPAEAKDPAEEGDEFVEFRLDRERYAVEQACVVEVVQLTDLTPLPCVPPFVAGIVNVRGQIYPVIDIKRFFDLPDAGITDLHLVIIVRAEGVELGLLADAVVGTRRIAPSRIQSTLPTLTGIRSQYLKGVTADHLVILNVAAMLGDPNIVVNEDMDSQERA